MDINYFHFTLDPVQSFIAQARRTRDFWAGSFILSWLSAVAMKAVATQAGCTIIFPNPDEDFLLWLEGKGKEPAPQHGSVPNRFKACVTDDFKPEIVVDAVNKAWKALADTVYKGDLKQADDKTQKIWDRQVKAYWDISWVITDDISNSLALDVRKNWRSYLPPNEAGVKWMMMDGWQELSGTESPTNKDTLKKFWQGLREKGNNGIQSDLRPNEYLCAIGFIKRRFVRHFHTVPATSLNGWTLSLAKWKVDVGRPSVAYMAAVHWLEKVLIEAEKNDEIAQQFEQFHHETAKLTKRDYPEWDSHIQCLESCKSPRNKKWQALDGNVFFESALENVNIFEDQTQAGRVLNELKELQRLANQAKPELQSATPFYAVLMMDGDSLGKQMSDPDKQETISQGLKDFTISVPRLVEVNNGFLIYAGGDDVLAILPLEDALPCALAIREQYRSIFKRLNTDNPDKPTVFTSISAAVVFAHIKMPLTKVLKEAHDLLDKVAKDEYGRDSLAVRVWKPSSQVLQWARPWKKAIAREKNDRGEKQLIITCLADKFGKDDKDGQLSNKFLYKIRERFELLNPPQKNNKFEKVEPVLTQVQAIGLMAAEYISSGLCEKIEKSSERMQHAEDMVKPLLHQCRPIYRKLDNANNIIWQKGKHVLVDGALLLRFLAQKGVGHE